MIMHTVISTTSAVHSLGGPNGGIILRVEGGAFAGRIAVLYIPVYGTLEMVWADAPYTVFSSSQQIATDCRDAPFSAVISGTGDIYAAYINLSDELCFVRLGFADGGWSIETTQTIFSAADASFPVICKLSTGQIWIAYTRYTGGLSYINAKLSEDDGATWTSDTNPGDTITSGDAVSAFCTMIEAKGYQYIIYTEGGTQLAVRAKSSGGAIWGGETILGSEGSYNDHLSAGVSSDGRLGIAYMTAGGLKYREFTGSTWSAEELIDAAAAGWPRVIFNQGNPAVVYLQYHHSDLTRLVVSTRDSGGFNTAEALVPGRDDPERVLLFNNSSGDYEDVTAQAVSQAAGDVIHPMSNALVLAEGDAIFAALPQQFSQFHVELSVVGSGGTVVWKYWDGQVWKSFVPESGAWSFTSATKDIALWQDLASIPTDWQPSQLGGYTGYWIRMEVTHAFGTAPVGSVMTGISKIAALSGEMGGAS